MTITPQDSGQNDVLGERHHLVALAFRMLGTVADAEDAVQETYIRWYRMSEQERAAIEVPRAWLMKAASRVCLNCLASAHHRREVYVGPWLPEPIPPLAFATPSARVGDPLDRVTLDESVSTALLVVLESMTPAERVVFVLHDVFAMPFDEIAEIVGRSAAACRQLAVSARRRVQRSRARRATHAERERVVKAFSTAARAGDLAGLVSMLDPDVVLRSDGGGVVTAARNPIIGREKVARFIVGALHKRSRSTVIEQETSDGTGFALWEDGLIYGIVTLDVAEGLVIDVRMMMNPAKLTLWN